MISLSQHRRVFATMLLAAGIAVFPLRSAGAQQAGRGQRTFASPEDAIKALRAAAGTHDKAALAEIFGPHVHELLTGDDTRDEADSVAFARAMEEGAIPIPASDDEMTLVLQIGKKKYPFPIPLVKENSVWRFDTAAGKEEIIDRHIGKDELHAIGVMLPYIQAQKQYATLGRDSSGTVQYARKLRSAPGRMDGLYWETPPNQVQSPFGADVAGADTGGVTPAKPFHGYFFKVLTRQGDAAPRGRMDYVKDGRLTVGFALVAYPSSWGRTGIMTFIVNQDGKIYQRNLGKKTAKIAAEMTEYNPGAGWTPVQESDVTESAL